MCLIHFVLAQLFVTQTTHVVVKLPGNAWQLQWCVRAFKRDRWFPDGLMWVAVRLTLALLNVLQTLGACWKLKAYWKPLVVMLHHKWWWWWWRWWWWWWWWWWWCPTYCQHLANSWKVTLEFAVFQLLLIFVEDFYFTTHDHMYPCVICWICLITVRFCIVKYVSASSWTTCCFRLF